VLHVPWEARNRLIYDLVKGDKVGGFAGDLRVPFVCSSVMKARSKS
jgi:hypothetical protein